MIVRELPFRLNVSFACLAGCIVASLAAVLVLVKTENALLAFLLSITIPLVCCCIAGIKNPRYVSTLAVYAFCGWLVGCLQPGAAIGPSQRLQEIIDSSLAGHDAVLPPLVLSSVLIIGRSLFVSRSQARRKAIDTKESGLG